MLKRLLLTFNLLLLLSSLNSFAEHICISRGIVAHPHTQWNHDSDLYTEESVITWNGSAFCRVDGLTTQLYGMVCAEGASPVAATVLWLPGETECKSISFYKTHPTATLFFPGFEIQF